MCCSFLQLNVDETEALVFGPKEEHRVSVTTIKLSQFSPPSELLPEPKDVFSLNYYCTVKDCGTQQKWIGHIEKRSANYG